MRHLLIDNDDVEWFRDGIQFHQGFFAPSHRHDMVAGCGKGESQRRGHRWLIIDGQDTQGFVHLAVC